MSKNPSDLGVDLRITQLYGEGIVGKLGIGYIHIVIPR
jgi:hypothetical protein